MKKSQVRNNLCKPNSVKEGKENKPIWWKNNANGIYIPKRKFKK